MVECSETFTSPFFHPGFALAAAEVRQNVHVAVVQSDGVIQGILPFERGRNSIGNPVGGRLSDFQGVVCSDETLNSGLSIPLVQWLDGCGLRALHYDHWLTSTNQTQPETSATLLKSQVHDAIYPSAFLDISGGYDAYYRRRIAQGSTRLRKVGQLERKVARECGEVCFCDDDQDPQAMQLLLEWKSQQYRQTGALDIFQYDWVRSFLRSIQNKRIPTFQGSMMTYRIAGKIAAVHLGMMTDRTVHWWFPAFDPDLGRYSPGLLMLAAGAKHFADKKGYQRIDMGRGDEAYKTSLTKDHSCVAAGTLERHGAKRAFRKTGSGVYQLLRRIPGKNYIKRSTAFFNRLRNHYDFR